MKNAYIMGATGAAIVNGDMSAAATAAALAELLQPRAMPPESAIPAGQPTASGFVPPRPGDATGHPLAEAVGDEFVAFAVAIRRKSVPAAAVKALAKKLGAAIEKETGRAPGRKQRKELEGRARDGLMPQAFAKVTKVPVLLDIKHGLLITGAAPGRAFDDSMSALSGALTPEGVKLAIIEATNSLPAIVAEWIREEADPDGIELGRVARLKGANREALAVRERDAAALASEFDRGMRIDSIAMTINAQILCTVASTNLLRGIKPVGFKPEKASEAWSGQTLLLATAIRDAHLLLVDHCGGRAEEPAEPGAGA